MHEAVINGDLEEFKKKVAPPIPAEIMLSKDSNSLNVLHKVLRKLIPCAFGDSFNLCAISTKYNFFLFINKRANVAFDDENGATSREKFCIGITYLFVNRL